MNLVHEVVSPLVTIEPEIAQYWDLEFQTAEFYDMARSSGLGNEDIEKFKINYSWKDTRHLGKYTSYNRTANVFVRACTDMDFSVNETTIHETGHYVDEVTNHINVPRRAYLAATTALFGVYTAGEVIQIFGHDTAVSEKIMFSAVALTALDLVAARLLIRRYERFANQYEDTNSNRTVVNLRPISLNT